MLSFTWYIVILLAFIGVGEWSIRVLEYQSLVSSQQLGAIRLFWWYTLVEWISFHWTVILVYSICLKVVFLFIFWRSKQFYFVAFNLGLLIYIFNFILGEELFFKGFIVLLFYKGILLIFMLLLKWFILLGKYFIIRITLQFHILIIWIFLFNIRWQMGLVCVILLLIIHFYLLFLFFIIITFISNN